jgi:hypothetical protein
LQTVFVDERSIKIREVSPPLQKVFVLGGGHGEEVSNRKRISILERWIMDYRLLGRQADLRMGFASLTGVGSSHTPSSSV